MISKQKLMERRARRVRFKIKKYVTSDCPRLSVFRSNRHIYAQIIDDIKGHTLVSCSSLDPEINPTLVKGSDKANGPMNGKVKGADVEAAEAVGKMLAKRAKAAGIKKISYDRGPYLYHGRIQALADGARAGGLEF